MDKLDLQTPDLTSRNVEKIAALFPNCVTETLDAAGKPQRTVDFDLLRQELSHGLVEGPQERYRLDWPGKREALALANQPIDKTLRPCRAESVDFDTTRNLYIEGDNLDALKLLQETYLGKVKMIYIDPPYNTGNDFIYDDNFSMNREDYEAMSGEVDEEGNAMFDEEKWKQNSSASGRFHSEWLSMMYPRLKLARNLLSDDGVIFISIDDAEIHNSAKIVEEIFGAGSHLSTFVRRRRMSTGMRNTPLSPDHEYILCYAKLAEVSEINGLRRDPSDFPLQDNIGLFRSTDLTVGMTKEMRPKQFYSIANPATGKDFWPSESRVWRFDRTTMKKHIDCQNIIWPDDTKDSSMTRPRYKTRLHPSEVGDLCNPVSTWLSNHSELGIPFQLESPLNQAATREVRDLFGNQLLEYPKPLRLLVSLAHIGSKKDSIILDFFSGSATTAHAVMQLNAEDGGSRRHIMVQLPEPCDAKSEAFKAGYATIAEIGKERIRRAGAKIRRELQEKLDKELPGSDEHTALKTRLDSLDTGFRVLKIDSGTRNPVFKRPGQLKQEELEMDIDNLRPDRTEEDLLFQVMLDWGTDLLSAPIREKELAGKRVFLVDDVAAMASQPALAACFATGVDDALIREIAAHKPLCAVFRDSGFASDAAKINARELFKALSAHTELKTL